MSGTAAVAAPPPALSPGVTDVPVLAAADLEGSALSDGEVEGEEVAFAFDFAGSEGRRHRVRWRSRLRRPACGHCLHCLRRRRRRDGGRGRWRRGLRLRRWRLGGWCGGGGDWCCGGLGRGWRWVRGCGWGARLARGGVRRGWAWGWGSRSAPKPPVSLPLPLPPSLSLCLPLYRRQPSVPAGVHRRPGSTGGGPRRARPGWPCRAGRTARRGRTRWARHRRCSTGATSTYSCAAASRARRNSAPTGP